MKGLCARVGLTACVAAAVVGPTGAAEPARRPASTRMVIDNGPMRTVHYFVAGATPAENAALRRLARAENELALADQLLALRREYVTDEQQLEGRRRAVQEQLLAIPGYATGVYPDEVGIVDNLTSFGAGRLGGRGGRWYGADLAWAYSGYAGYGYGSGQPVGAAAGTTLPTVDEGVIKSQLARTLAGQATPEYAARAERDYDAALAQAASSARLRTALRLPAAPPARRSETLPRPVPKR